MIPAAGLVGTAGGARKQGGQRCAGQQGGASPAPTVRRLLLPAAAEGTVELNETLVFSTASTSESEFGAEEGALAIEDFEIRGGATSVAHIGQADRLDEVRNAIFLADADLVALLVADECIGNISERVLDRLAVGDQRLLVLRFGDVQVAAKSSAGENGLAHVGAVGPDSELRTHQAGEGAAASKRAAAGAGERDLRKELSFGNTDFSVGSDHGLLSFANIGAALK